MQQPLRMTVTHYNVNVNVVALAVIGLIGYFGYEIFQVVGEDLPEDPITRPSKNEKFRKFIKRML